MICRQTERREEHASSCIWRLIYMKGCLIQSCTQVEAPGISTGQIDQPSTNSGNHLGG